MLNDSQRVMVQTKGVVIGRILMGLLFFSSGVGMLLTQTPEGVAGYFGSLDLPMPLLLAWLVIILKIVAGGALIIGKHVGNAACALIVFTALTILIAHRDLADVNLFKNLAIIGGLMYVMAFGAGRWNGGSN
jgi:putative oxidoreductase